jgi:hypothetical protein
MNLTHQSFSKYVIYMEARQIYQLSDVRHAKYMQTEQIWNKKTSMWDYVFIYLYFYIFSAKPQEI